MNVQNELKNIRNKTAKLPRRKLDVDEQAFVQKYLGSRKKHLGTKTGDNIKIAKEIIREQSAIETDKLVDLLSRLFAADTFEEYLIGGKIFTLLKPEVRTKISFDQLEKWLAKARGWVEIDIICQSSYSGAEVLARRSDWEKMIRKFSRSKIISLRRASLVLQNLSIRKTNEKKLRRLAFEIVEQLKPEKEVLITKAISWLLRSLSELDKEEVRTYLLENEASIPRLAFRETMKKIETGTKNGARRRSTKK